MLASEQRQELVSRQQALLRGLLGLGPMPAGFDPRQLETAARSLHDKRRRGVAKTWPVLAEALGPKFPEHFDVYAGGRDQPRDGGPLADGREFAAWLEAQGLLPEAARGELAAVDLRFARTATGLVRRRRPSLCWRWRLLAALHLPGLGEWWFGPW